MKYTSISFALLVCLVSCDGPEQKPSAKSEPVKSMNASRNSDEFNGAMINLLNSYDSLKSALVDYDTTRANAAALLLGAYLDSLPLKSFPEDSSGSIAGNARNFAIAMKTAAVNLMKDTTLEKKKRRFHGLSEGLYGMMRSVKYDRQVVYHQHCPMAFNGEEEAFWLSTSSQVVNPYLGRKHPKYKDAMLACGDVADSLDYSR